MLVKPLQYHYCSVNLVDNKTGVDALCGMVQIPLPPPVNSQVFRSVNKQFVSLLLEYVLSV